MSLSDETEWRLFATMLLMRRFEEAVQKFAEERKFSGHYHLCIGQEATGAAAMAALRDGDHITTTHRNHGHIIARGADPSRALAEILGRQTGLNHGHGGTFHLCEPTLGFLSTSGIVGGAISLAVGGGYACKQRGDGSVTLAFFGDGALQEGIAYEAMNIASLWKLPVVFICENNDAGAPPGEEHAASDLANVPRALEIKTQKIEGIDPAVVHAAVAEAVARCRAGQGPAFIEARTKRWPGNAQQFPRLVTGDRPSVVSVPASANVGAGLHDRTS